MPSPLFTVAARRYIEKYIYIIYIEKLIKTRIFHKRNVLLELFLLLQNQVTMTGRVPRLGKYVFVVHFYQPAHPTFPVRVHVNAGHVWSGRNPNLI